MDLQGFPKDYLNDVLIRMAYHSSAIATNKITLAETVSIIGEGYILSDEYGFSIQDFYQVENHQQTFQYMLDLIKQNNVLTFNILKNFHALLIDRRYFNGHCYKTTSSTDSTVTSDLVDIETEKVQNLINSVNIQLASAQTKKEAAKILATFHLTCMQYPIFHFENGLTARMTNLFLAMKYGFSPVVIKESDRDIYLKAIENGDNELLAELFFAAMQREKKRRTIFSGGLLAQ